MKFAVSLRRRSTLKGLMLFCLLAVLSDSERVGRNGAYTTRAFTVDNAGIATEPQKLIMAANITSEISPGEQRMYEIGLAAGQQVRIGINKGDLQLKVLLCAQKVQSCFEFIGRRYGTLDISFSAEVSATYRLEISSLEKETAKRTYELRVDKIVVATPRDNLADKATRTLAEAEALREHPDAASQLAAVQKYDQARQLWEAAGESSSAIQALCSMGDVRFVLSQYKTALAEYSKALSISEAKSDDRGRLAALNGISYTNVYLGENKKAALFAKKMLEIIAATDPATRSTAYKRAEAKALNTLGEVDYALGELHQSIEKFEHAYSEFVEVAARDGQALALLNLGYSQSDLGKAKEAFDYFERSLVLFQSLADGRGSALAQTALGGAHSLLGEEQAALDLHTEARDYFRTTGNKQGEAAALNGIARAYQDLNEHDAAFDNYYQALRLYEAIGNRAFVALNKFLVGRALYQRGDVKQALNYYQESSSLSQQVGDQVTEAHALKGIGTIYFSKHDSEQALAHFGRALEIYLKLGNRRSQAYVLNDIGHIQVSSHKLPEALANFQAALALMRDTGDRHGEALTLFNTAQAERDLGNLTLALSSIEASIAIGESLRTKIKSSQLRTSFFASVHQQYELYINILMRLHAEHQDDAYAKKALVASEKARARSLLDSLMGEKIESSQMGAAVDLLQQEQELIKALDEKAEYETRVLTGKHTKEDADKVSQEIGTLKIEYQELREKLREQSPRRAVLIQPEVVRVEDLQKIVNSDTLLLEFALGEERSYLWVISPDEITSYELPARAEIEVLARQVYELLTARQSLAEKPTSNSVEKVKDADMAYQQKSAALSRMLLGPMSERLGTKRLLIVADGFLHFIPFEALPLPSSATEVNSRNDAEVALLFFEHEIVSLPSALSLIALRNERRPAVLPSKTIAIVADPVFERDDPRVLRVIVESRALEKEAENPYLSFAMRDFNEIGGPQNIPRLPSTLREAKAIMDFIPSGDGTITTGFAATKQRFMLERMSDYRILHLATHGLLNIEHPELSGVILSLVDERGQAVNGFLRLHDIYDLDLPVDLVVLSACRTGLGKNVQGEGVVGLSSGFMFAGARSVVASLWKVDDDATAELMSHFYANMLREKMPPAAALRAAKLQMWKQERRRPAFYWAGFVLQGEYSEEFRVSRHWEWNQIFMVAALLALLVFCLYAVVWIRRRARKA